MQLAQQARPALALRAGLGALLEEHGLPHPTKDTVKALMRESRQAMEAGGWSTAVPVHGSLCPLCSAGR